MRSTSFLFLRFEQHNYENWTIFIYAIAKQAYWSDLVPKYTVLAHRWARKPQGTY